MGVIIAVIVAFILGDIAGVVLMCVLQINRQKERSSNVLYIDYLYHLKSRLEKFCYINKDRTKTKYERGYYNATQDIINVIKAQIDFEEELQ